MPGLTDAPTRRRVRRLDSQVLLPRRATRDAAVSVAVTSTTAGPAPSDSQDEVMQLDGNQLRFKGPGNARAAVLELHGGTDADTGVHQRQPQLVDLIWHDDVGSDASPSHADVQEP